MTDRGPVTRCRIKACPVVGYFSAYGDLCPIHRNPRSAEGQQERVRVGIDLPPISMEADDD